ncbi:MAG: MG2 domain-containing protein, partial [Gemmataceae bacterium]
MSLYRNAGLLAAGLGLLVTGLYQAAAENPTIEQNRATARKQFQDGNFNDAYKLYRQIALDKGNPIPANDLEQGLQALARLGRIDEIDEFREAVVQTHSDKVHVLFTAARSYLDYEHHGYIVAGQFSRGYKRGGGKYVNAFDRDRVRAMQLLVQGMPLARKEKDTQWVSNYFMSLAHTVRTGSTYRPAWKLQELTDLSTLPDYEEGTRYYGRGWRRSDRGWSSSDDRGAPVTDNGEPLYYALPKSWETAANDGERWRWCLAEVAQINPSRLNEIALIWADFCRSQYGVQTLLSAPKDTADKEGTFSLHTLKDSETIARLATGVKRFALPKEHNFIDIYRGIIARGGSEALTAHLRLAEEFEDRRQYPKAADTWRELIAKHGKGHQDEYQKRLDQIVGNWGIIEPFGTQPAVTKATFDLRFRNAKKVTFTAHAIQVEKLLADVRDYLKSNPRNLDWRKTNIENLGYRLVHQNEKTYLGDQVATWSLELQPRPNHVDDRVTVQTPLTKAGAYLIEAKMEGGNTTRCIAWIADTVLVKKMLQNQAMYFVADAITGKPIDKANLEFFGWHPQWVPHPAGGGYHRVITTAMAHNSDADGMVLTGPGDQPSNYNWLVIARKKGDGPGGADRFAYLGFSNVWYNREYDPQYHATRVFTITDRPVYRPEHTVQFKAWVRHAKYDMPNVSDFAGQCFHVVIHNPKGDKVYEADFKADDYAGIAGEWKLPKDAPLGVYSIHVNWFGGGHVGTFRVEEYKKPEFEVKVEAPKEPTKLGDKIEATVQARYYFGAPVTNGKAKIKVLRTPHSTTWYAPGRWDWFYGKGYWWFAPDYVWYPGFDEWGCYRPRPAWWIDWRPEPPEVVLDTELPVGPDGEIKVVIDTAIAKELHGDTDHRYSITAEVVDESRRTIVGSGDVIAARKPFRVFGWLDRGHYRAGDTIKASFQALTPDQKPVKGLGKLSLRAIEYQDAKPFEKEVESWDLNTDETGSASMQIKAAKAGQYRLVYQLTDAKKNTIEGGYLFVIRGEGFTGKEYRFNDIEIITDKREYADGDKAKLLISTNQEGGTVLMFDRPAGVYRKPKVIRINGKSIEETLDITKKDMPL